MRILVTGEEEPIAHELLHLCRNDMEVLGVSQSRLDLTDLDRVRDMWARYQPAVVIHAAGLHDMDICTAQPWEALRMNALTTHNVALACMESNAALAFISTEQVFSGTKQEPYFEWDVPDPINWYGQSRAMGERMVRDHLSQHYIIRVQSVFSKFGDNSMLRLLRDAQEGKPIQAAQDDFTKPTCGTHLADAINRLVRSKLYGTYHITSGGNDSGISWFDWTKKILSSAGMPDVEVQPIVTACDSGRVSCVLGNTFYRMRGFGELPNWDEALVSMFSETPPPPIASQPSPPR